MSGKEHAIEEIKYTIRQVADFLGGISRITVWREINRGHLSHYRIGAGRIMIGASHLSEYLKSREVRANN